MQQNFSYEFFKSSYLESIFFDFVFVLMLKILFIVIIIFNYMESTSKLQIVAEAMAQIIAEKSNKLKENWMNLILMKLPKKKEDESFQDENGLTIIDIFRYNLDRLNIGVKF